MSESQVVTSEVITIEVDVQRITYGEFKRLVKVQEGVVPVNEAFDILDKCLTQNVDNLPAVEVVPLLVEAISENLTQRFSRKN